MKKAILLFSLVSLVFLTSCKEDVSQKIEQKKLEKAAQRDAKPSKFPVIEFDKTEHDFGEVESKKPVETTFKYKNVGEAPLVITDVKSSCGCTVPKNWTRTPLAPGESGEFSVRFNGSGKNKITKTITVTANTEKGREVVKIMAFVKPDENAEAQKKLSAPPKIK